MPSQVRDATDRLAAVQTKLDEAEGAAAPHLARIDATGHVLRQAEHDVTVARLKERVAGLSFEPPTRRGRGAEIETLAMG